MRWEEITEAVVYGYSGRVVAVMLHRREDYRWAWQLNGVPPDEVRTRGTRDTLEQAKGSAERAWGRWVDAAGLALRPPRPSA